MIISLYAQIVTLSNMSHLVYITLFGETDGVTLSRLRCKEGEQYCLSLLNPKDLITLHYPSDLG